MEVCFDPSLMQRYDREGPRYTSYPTALQFHGHLPPSAYDSAARNSPGATGREPLSIYAHIPFCFSPCFYCGCTKIVTRQTSRAEEYLRDLGREMALRSRSFDPARRVEQLHLGGGTPTFLSTPQLGAFIEQLARHFTLTDDPSRDYSIEIDPRTVSAASIQELADIGFNRISLGVQDFDPEVQAATHRLQPPAMVQDIVDAARGAGLRSINVDLIYGLPRQTPARFAATLDRVIGMRPDRLAVYGYAHMPAVFKAQRQIRAVDLPDAATRLALLQLTVNTLTQAGYDYIGMDHFALPGDALALAQRTGSLQRSFQGYTTHASRDLVSLGVSAIGQVGGLYVQNHKGLPEYRAALDRGLLPHHRGVMMTRDDRVRKDAIQQIMCHGRLDFAAVERSHDIVFEEYFAAEWPRLRALATDGLVNLGAGEMTLTARGRLLMRSVAMTFDAYLAGRTERAAQSRVI